MRVNGLNWMERFLHVCAGRQGTLTAFDWSGKITSFLCDAYTYNPLPQGNTQGTVGNILSRDKLKMSGYFFFSFFKICWRRNLFITSDAKDRVSNLRLPFWKKKKNAAISTPGQYFDVEIRDNLECTVC